MKRILRWAGVAVLGLAVIAGVVYATRTNPIAMVAGRQLTGTVVSEPVTNWDFTDDHQLIAIETRPAAPHSVTTVCFTHEGALYVPAQGGAAKSWPHYVVSDPRVRVKIGDEIYPAVATRVTDASLQPALIASAAEKYDFELPQGPDALEDVWVFRIESAPAEVGAGRP
ncbi:MAG: hypothetical protein JRG76_19925 [Deltaproteobacteria bacterium]|nr:hypothetical protein [Deltaproteobacteria bacterium]